MFATDNRARQVHYGAMNGVQIQLWVKNQAYAFGVFRTVYRADPRSCLPHYVAGRLVEVRLLARGAKLSPSDIRYDKFG